MIAAIHPRVPVLRLPHGEGLPLPSYQSAGAAGADLYAAIASGETVTLQPGQHRLIPTGISLELSMNYEAQLRPRSGIALKHGVTVLNSPGTIDSDYRGEIGVILINLGAQPFDIVRGARIAQLVIAPVSRVTFIDTQALSHTARAAGGFGSSGSHET